MPYTISSRGRPIGTTSLGFVHLDDRFRMGWFYPNADGQRLMPKVAAVHQALQACRRLHLRAARTRVLTPADLGTTTEYAELAAAIAGVSALDLSLQLETGATVPTESIGLQDTEELLTMARLDEEELVEPAWEADDPGGEELRALLEAEVEAEAGEAWCAADDSPHADAWMTEPEPTDWSRYQVHVRLAPGIVLP